VAYKVPVINQSMPPVTWDIHTASEEWLVQLCERTGQENGRISDHKQGDRVVKLSDEIAVKFGHGVRDSEARTQEFAHKKANPSLVRVPRVHRFFQRNDPSWHCPRGYLFMEYVSGRLPQELDLSVHNDIIPRVAKIIEHLGQIHNTELVPGPIGGGEPEGYFWGDDGARTTFTCREDLEAWLNKRLALRDKSVDLGPSPLVLCHMDLRRRNMILEEDSIICLVDWGFAGMYPRFFEVANLSWINPYDEHYEKPLLQRTGSLLNLTAEEKGAMGLLQIARAANMRYTL
jgi:aminoglycoside phosphotransferase (APT) family kinase protein